MNKYNTIKSEVLFRDDQKISTKESYCNKDSQSNNFKYIFNSDVFKNDKECNILSENYNSRY